MLSREDKIWYVRETINQIYDREGVDLDDPDSIINFAGHVHYTFKAVPFKVKHRFYTRPGEYIDIQFIIPAQDGHDEVELNSTIT